MPVARLTLRFFRRELRNRFAGSFTGGLWALLQPLVQLAVYAFVFVQVFKSADRYKATAKFSTWLFTIARRLILDRRRSERRSRMVATVEEGDAVTTFDALDTMVADESMVRVRMAVDALSQKQKEVFMLRLEQGLSYKEIAELVGTTEGAARVHYHNAMRAVKEFLDDE